MRRLIPLPLTLVLLTLVGSVSGAASERVMAPAERAYSAFADDPHRQFDFWIGEWDVNLRMIQEDLTFRDSIAARASIYSILDGKAILELWDSAPIKGYSLRYFDPAKESWVLWLDWPSKNRASKSSLEGSFRHGRGSFHTAFTDAEGNEIRGRYSFNDITPFSLRWDDLWSRDGGKSWGKNWIMEWTRRAIDPTWPEGPESALTFDTGARCDESAFRPYEALAGSWGGDDGRLAAYRVLDGCAVMAFFESDATSEFLIFTWVGAKERWEVDVLDARRGSPLVTYSSGSEWSRPSSPAGDRVSFEIEGDRLLYRRPGGETAMVRR